MDEDTLDDFKEDIRCKTASELLHLAILIGYTSGKQREMHERLLRAYKTFGETLGKCNEKMSDRFGRQMQTGLQQLDGDRCTFQPLSTEALEDLCTKYKALALHEATGVDEFVALTQAFHAVKGTWHTPVRDKCNGCSTAHARQDAMDQIDLLYAMRVGM